MDQIENTTALPADTAVILVDHGSRRAEANVMLEAMARLYAGTTGAPMVEPAHMELASPSIEEALARCVARGARRVVIMPYFLFPGRHSAEDIPRMARAAAAAHPDVAVLVSEPLGVDQRLAQVAHARVLARLEDAV